MSVRKLAKTLCVWRIGDPDGKYPIYSGEGATLCEGRWHQKGQEVIYTSEHYGTAMLEKLVHYNGIMPPNQHFLKIKIPLGVAYEEATKDSLPNWHQSDGAASRKFGSQWINEARSGILIVPSYVSREEMNILVNPNHTDAHLISPDREKPVRWDERFFDS